MRDGFGREINYLRVSVTDRCNLRCRYCRPISDLQQLPRQEILSYEEIVEVVRAAVSIGVNKVRLTGGEPLARLSIEMLVRALAALPGIDDLAMTTNGTMLARHAKTLAEAGLRRVNISLDTLDPARYRELTRGGEVAEVLAGIEAAQQAGLTPIKINCVTGGFLDGADLPAVREFAARRGLQFRAISMMDFERGQFSVVEGGGGGDCGRCNRLRLSSDGRIRPCLFSDRSYSVRELGAERALRMAVENKPRQGGACTHNWMHGIGG